MRNSILLKFLVVGGLGTITNLLVFYLLADVLGLAPVIATTLAFGIAVSQNYILNEKWSFRRAGAGNLNAARFLRYVSGNLLGFVINLGVVAALLGWFYWPLKSLAQALAIALATGFNYLWAKRMVFGGDS